MNSILAKVTGSSIQEDDVVPVPAGGLTRRNYRDRAMRDRVKRQGDKEGDMQESDLRRVLGEAERNIIPDNAEEIDDGSQSVLPKSMKPIKDVVQEPSYPYTEKEKLLTPYAALTAPDATPDALKPIPPSKVPGNTMQTFTSAELEKSNVEEPEETIPPSAEEFEGPGVDKATRAMDVLLGRDRGARPAKTRAEAEQAAAITTEAAAYNALKIDPPGMAETLAATLTPGIPMPEPKQADGKPIYEAFRRFNG